MEKNYELNKVVGPSFEELSIDEMVASQGSGDVQAETTPLCIVTAAAASFSLGTGITVSLKHC